MSKEEVSNSNDTVSSSKKNVDGIILVLSCHKHKNTRLKEFSLHKTSYNNWEVIYVIGDLFLKENYILEGNILYLRCEDSYLHLLKKLVLAIKSVKEIFNVKYYKNHKDDFLNPRHGMMNMSLVTLLKYIRRPNIYGAAGVIFYLSNKACDIIVDHMEKINFDVLSYDKFTKSYPYTIEDCGVSFIMYYNDIMFKDAQFFYDTPYENTIAKHTNKYK
jgi:hypothetical protein